MGKRGQDIIRAVLFVLIFGVTLLIGYLTAMQHDKRWDVSRAGQNTLDARSRRIAGELSFDVRILAFCSLGEMEKDAKALLDLYSLESRHLAYEVLDPDARPATARQHGITRYGQASLLGRGRAVTIDVITEEGISNALLKLQRDRKKNVYVLSGHGESSILETGKGGLSHIAKSLERDGCEVRDLFLMRRSEIPQDADLLMIVGPEASLVPEEIDAVRSYLKRGGNAFIALEPHTDGGLKDLLGGYGVDLDDTVITDPSTKVLGSDAAVPVVNSYNEIENLGRFRLATVYPTARPLWTKNEPPQNVTVSWLARTSENSRADTRKAGSGEPVNAAAYAPYKKGPLNIALYLRTILSPHAESRAVIFGDADFLTNAYLNISGNRDLAMNCIHMLLNEGLLISIDSRVPGDRPFMLTPGQGAFLFCVSVIVIPSLILAPVLFLNRRRTRK